MFLNYKIKEYLLPLFDDEEKCLFEEHLRLKKNKELYLYNIPVFIRKYNKKLSEVYLMKQRIEKLIVLAEIITLVNPVKH